MKIAVYQCESGSSDVAGNLARMSDAAREAAEAGVTILVFPEMMLSGYRIGHEAIECLAEPADGASATSIAEIASHAGIHIAYGYPERCERAIYNSAQLIDANGRRRLNYRKTHLFGDAERSAFKAGMGTLELVEMDGWRTALLICYDIEFPETVRSLALEGADLVLVPTALMAPYDAVARFVVPARAVENQLYVAYANYCGREADLSYCGLNVIASPQGDIDAQAGTDAGLVYAEFDVNALKRSRALNPYLQDRIPELYGRLVEPGGKPGA